MCHLFLFLAISAFCVARRVLSRRVFFLYIMLIKYHGGTRPAVPHKAYQLSKTEKTDRLWRIHLRLFHNHQAFGDKHTNPILGEQRQDDLHPHPER